MIFLSFPGVYFLINFAAKVCYMNSLMQQLYMIPPFREFVLQVEDKQFTNTPKEDNVLYQLKVKTYYIIFI